MASIDDATRRDRFVAVARLAFEIWRQRDTDLAGGVQICRALDIVAGARERLASRQVGDPREWVRSEAEAGLLWAFQSPDVAKGLYACVDVGAGTTDVSVFRIKEDFVDGRWTKSGMVFYSAVSGTPGVDRLDRLLSESAGDGQAFEVWRGREAEALAQADETARARAAEVAAEMHAVYKKGWQQAYGKEQVQSAWDHYKLFVLGGGSQIPDVSAALTKTTWNGLADRQIARPGFPDDLFELPQIRSRGLTPFSESPAFLLVAYGLSWLGADVPEVVVPNEVASWRPSTTRRERLEQDELYPK
jgi:hypothetical protein